MRSRGTRGGNTTAPKSTKAATTTAKAIPPPLQPPLLDPPRRPLVSSITCCIVVGSRKAADNDDASDGVEPGTNGDTDTTLYASILAERRVPKRERRGSKRAARCDTADRVKEGRRGDDDDRSHLVKYVRCACLNPHSRPPLIHRLAFPAATNEGAPTEHDTVIRLPRVEVSGNTRGEGTSVGLVGSVQRDHSGSIPSFSIAAPVSFPCPCPSAPHTQSLSSTTPAFSSSVSRYPSQLRLPSPFLLPPSRFSHFPTDIPTVNLPPPLSTRTISIFPWPSFCISGTPYVQTPDPIHPVQSENPIPIRSTRPAWGFVKENNVGGGAREQGGVVLEERGRQCGGHETRVETRDGRVIVVRRRSCVLELERNVRRYRE
ncbi:hypothetical protein R3P38DRAFT_3524216 [Favolaschia claudopus]|uniref:Uncharacterized protein n=1 Tax=Favolaschia claudopus TaxID=2862362 RepID=A0AAW0E8E2_9AGAR